MSQVSEPFSVMVKPVSGLCNLRCHYCYYIGKPDELYRGACETMKMSHDVLEEFTRQYLEAQIQQCHFAWQGGEPLLAGKDFFAAAVAAQKRMASPDQIVTNAIQTNGTPLDDPWGEFLGTNGFLVGISIDGPAQWHDRFRRDGDNEPTFHRAWAGLELLRKHHVEFNVLATLNSANAPHAGDVYRYFVNHGVTYLQFIPILERTVEGRPTNFSCTPEQFGRFMLEVFEQWATRDVGRVSERFIDSVLHTLIHGQASLCCYAKRCANAFVLEWNGDLYACDHFVYPQWRIGNIQERPLSELVRDDLVEQFAAQKTQLSHRCRDCEYQSFCFGGCPKHHVPIGTDGSRVNHFCEGYRLFFREALPELRRMAKYIERGEMPPLRPAAPRPGASSQQTSPERPGRNDPCPCRSRRKFKNCCGRN